MSLISAIQDGFTSSTLNTTLWNANGTPAPTLDTSLDRVILPCTTDYAGLGSTPWDATGSSIYARLTAPPVGNGTTELLFELWLDTNNRAMFYVSGGDFNARVKNAGVSTTVNIGTYDAVAHKWWRIREFIGSFIFDTSPDGVLWTTRATIAYTFAITAITFQVRSGYYGTEAAGLYSYVDHVNTPTEIVPTIPPVTVEVAFDGGPYSSSYSWTDITSWVKGFGSKRGRSYEVDRIEAGTLDLTLDNSDGRFTPMKDWSTELLSGNVATGTDTLGTTSGFLVNTAQPGITMASGTSTPHSGTKALQYLGTSATAATLVYNAQTAVKPGNKYVASAWVRNTVTAGYATMPQRVVLRWRDSAGVFISDSNGATWDGVSTSWVQVSATGVAPPNAAYAILIIAATAVVSSSWVYWTDDWSLAEVAPYYPNVIPRRRVRVRTANLLPKDTATGGDVSQSSVNFQTSHVSGQSSGYTSGIYKQGNGSTRVDFVKTGDGTTYYNSSIRCGFFETITWGGWGKWNLFAQTRLEARGLARVVAGKTYTASGWYRMGAASYADTVTARIRWYKDDGTFYNSSSSTVITTVIGSWVYWTVTGVAGGSSSSGVSLAGVEIGTPGLSASVYGYVDNLQIEEASSATTWTPGGSIFSGFVEKWPVKLSGLTSEVSVSAVDAFNILGTTELQRPMRQHIMSTAPWGYWPLTEGAGATSAQNLADDTKPAPLKASKYGGGTAAFGAASIVANDDGTSFSVVNVSNTKGTVVDCTNGGLAVPTIATEFAASFWCLPTRPSSGTVSNLFRTTGVDGLKAAELVLDSDGYITINVGFPDNTANAGGGWHQSVSEIQLSSSTPSLVTISITAGEGTLYINDQWATSTADTYGAAVAPRLRAPNYITLGGNLSPAGPFDFTSGRFGHLAIWDRALTTEHEMTYYIGAGNYGSSKSAFYESEGSRLSRLVRYAGFTGETVLDASVSGILGFDWETGDSALEQVQSTAEDASGYAFMDGDGRLVYHSRKRRQSAPLRFTLGESANLPYESDLDFQVDEDRIVNEVAFTRSGGASGLVRDQDSIATHGRKTKSIDLSVSTDGEVTNAAYWNLNQYKAPVMRCDEVTLSASACPVLFPVVLGVEIGDRIRLGDLPAAAPSSSLDFYVEAINTTVTADGVTPEWVTVLSLSPAVVSDVWVLEDASFGLLDQTADLAF